MSTRFTRLFGRKATKGRYDEEDTSSRTLPSAPESSINIEKTDKKAKDKAADQVDDQVDKEHDAEDKDATTNVVVTQTRERADGPIRKTNAGTSGTSKAEGVYSRLWKRKTDFSLQPIIYSSSAHWIPNCIPLTPLLKAITTLVGQSNYAAKHEKNFNPYAFATGIYYLQYIQILRAQKAATELVGMDSTALARFEKYNPLNSIMIPEPLIPFFESIAAVKLQDSKYAWILPSHGLDFGNAKATTDLMQTTTLSMLQPNLTFMIANLHQFAAASRADLANMIDDGRIFRPMDIHNPDNTGTNQEVTIFGQDVTFDGPTATVNLTDIRYCPQHVGATFPFQFWNENYLDAHQYIRNSKFLVKNGTTFGNSANRLGFAAVTRNVNQGHPIALVDGTDANHRFRALDSMLYIAKENNPSWFQYLTEQINIVARFFNNSKPMSKIAVTGGMEPTVIAQLKLEQNLGTAANQNYLYDNAKLGRTDFNEISFYEDQFADLTATFRTTRADIERNEELNAISLATNANPPIHGIAPADIRGGQFFQDINNGMQHMEMLHLGYEDRNIRGEVPMYDGWMDDFVKPAFNKKPTDA